MPYTTTNKIPMPSENGSNNSAVVGQAIQELENLVDGVYSFDLSGSNKTVDDTTNYSNNAIYGHWFTIGTLTANRELIAPSRSWQRFVTNNCTGSFTAKVVLSAGGSGITVAAGTTAWLRCDGTTITSVTIPAELDDSGVTADSYTNANITVNEKGVITAASNGTASSGMNIQGGKDCSANPDYPSATKGDLYYVTVAGKIGGASGKSVSVGDAIVASADNAGGDQSTVGSSWFVLESNAVNWADIVDKPSFVAAKYTEDIGDGTSTDITVTHSLGTQDICSVLIRENASPYAIVQPSGVTIDDTDNVTVSFSVAPTTDQYRVIITG